MKFKVTLMIPQETVIEEQTIQDAHNRVTKMLGAPLEPGHNEPRPRLHSIIEIPDAEVINFGPFDAA